MPVPGQLGRRPTDPARYAHVIRLPLTGAVPAAPARRRPPERGAAVDARR